MAKNITYGMGQYRFNKNFSYIDKEGYIDTSLNPTRMDYFTNDSGGINYEDIQIDITGLTTDGAKYNYVQYGTTYYMELTVPQNRKYQLTLNLKLCGEKTAGVPDLNHFQNIKRLIVPPTPALDDITSEVILYEDPRDDNKHRGLIRAAVIDEKHTFNENSNAQSINIAGKENHDVYYNEFNSTYFFIDTDDINNPVKEITKSPLAYRDKISLTQDWKITNSGSSENPATVTFKFAFSPKYQQTQGFPYLVIETERTGNENHTIEYVKSGVTYYGTVLNKDLIKMKLYGVTNLLEDGTIGVSQVQSGTSQLTHIAVWGHPEQIITINGEEVKIGQTNFYELKDFNITYLGVVVTDPMIDRFTIDYEYKIAQET